MELRRVRVVMTRAFHLGLVNALDAGGVRDLGQRVGLSADGDRLELYLPAAERAGGLELSLRVRRISTAREPIPGAARVEAGFGPGPILDLVLGEDGFVRAEMRLGDQVHSVDEIVVGGAAQERWVRNGNGANLVRPSLGVHASHGDTATGGLAGTSLAIGGCSRLGSLIASAAVRAGAGALTLIDGDGLEEHAFDAIDCTPDGVGRPKVDTVREHLLTLAPQLVVRALRMPVEGAAAYLACALADVLVSAPDDNRARLTVALAATAHLRPHLDLGSGVFAAGELAGGETWIAGADLRLILPGEGCLLCIGGLRLARRREADWRRQRAGSLRSLNLLAAGQALALLEALRAGELRRSTWLRLMVEPDGSVRVVEQSFQRVNHCPLCSRYLGAGSAALAVLGGELPSTLP